MATWPELVFLPIAISAAVRCSGCNRRFRERHGRWAARWASAWHDTGAIFHLASELVPARMMLDAEGKHQPKHTRIELTPTTWRRLVRIARAITELRASWRRLTTGDASIRRRHPTLLPRSVGRMTPGRCRQYSALAGGYTLRLLLHRVRAEYIQGRLIAVKIFRARGAPVSPACAFQSATASQAEGICGTSSVMT